MGFTMPLRGAIAGCGFFGQFHIEGWSRIPEARLVAACDPDLDRARKAAPSAFADFEQMLDVVKPDFVDIATRPELHLPMLRAAAERKIAVICQKPMAPTWEDCQEMVRVAESAGIPFMVHENWRWQAWFRAVGEMTRGGQMGAPVTYTFRTRKRDGAGPEPYTLQPYFREMPRLLLFETLVHHIDTARYLFGDVRSIFARLRRVNPRIAGEDQAHIVLSHASGLSGLIDGNRFTDLAPDSPPLGDATFEFEDGWLHVSAVGDIYRGGERIWKNEIHTGYRGDSVRAASQHFVQCLLSGAPFESSGREYLKTVAVVEAGYRSHAEGRPVEVLAG
ncbi:MAG: Gfo/Idh/MocA family oxidoreductase [Acidobacteria bacterium]|nr:Gfo/Idh/MocA family oxidoreductase [Acidobacteriota bacterium]